ncbi:MAG: hypothetical protein LBJ44_06240 [Propionibacteriaceae bacterium]|nr:hypothetical protein [Propionibacteriaceae bacterium]
MSLAADLSRFGGAVLADLPRLFHRHAAQVDDGPCFVDQPGRPRRVRPNCDAVEIAAMFDQLPPGRSRAGWVELLGSCQDSASGLVGEHLACDRRLDPPPRPDGPDRYTTMAVNYALECLGAHLPTPVHDVAAIDADRLVHLLEAQAWDDDPWEAGHWVDCHASCMDANVRHFSLAGPVEVLFDWLDAHCDKASGLWGTPGENGWLLPVNGFYRLTRGTYAQFGRPLPHPAAARATVWAHCGDQTVFGQGRGTACQVLDVVHPLWLCQSQGLDRLGPIEDWTAARLRLALSRWSPGQGFAFDPADGEPGLQGTEMWLSIVYLMAQTLGLADQLGYRPRGVHRLEPPTTGDDAGATAMTS